MILAVGSTNTTKQQAVMEITALIRLENAGLYQNC